ncbi:MAG: hypothetical protein ABSC94_32520 [Polyangiaceae bacterium]
MPNEDDRGRQHEVHEEAKPPESVKLSVCDESVRAIRDRLWVAKSRIEIAMRFTMWTEVRQELEGVQSDLATALKFIGR